MLPKFGLDCTVLYFKTHMQGVP